MAITILVFLLIVLLGVGNAFFSPVIPRGVKISPISAKEEAPEKKKAKLGFGDLVQVSYCPKWRVV